MATSHTTTPGHAGGVTADREGRKVGDIAQATGLTVRTLHHYEEIGLLVPARDASGHRRYGADDVERLYRIALLRQLGLPLGQIAHALDDPAWNLPSAMATHLGDLDRRLEATVRMRSRLSRLLASAGPADTPPRPDATEAPSPTPPATDDLLDLLEEMTMLESTLERRISILVYADIERAHAFLTDVFGLGPGELTHHEGVAVHGEIQAGDGVVWLHPESPAFGLSSPRTLGGSTGSMAVMVDDVDAHFRYASEHGAEIVYEPVDQPYGYREYSARDSEGGLWSFMKPLA